MQRHRKILLLLLTVVAVTTLSALTALSSQEQRSTASPTQQSAEEEQEPVADYAAIEPADPEKRAKRRARGKRYDGQSWVREPHPTAGDAGRIDSWMGQVPAFPTETSHAVVIGETIDAQAYLSNDKSGVYTEFTVRVEEILKQDAVAPLVVGETLAAQREGGRVRFPSGRVQRYRTHYQHLPCAGRRYVFFLKRNEEGQAYYIRTAYELRAGRVHPVDGVNMNKGAAELPQFAAYKDADEATFLSAVRDAVARSLQSSPE
jgi:hypothetical protein